MVISEVIFTGCGGFDRSLIEKVILYFQACEYAAMITEEILQTHDLPRHNVGAVYAARSLSTRIIEYAALIAGDLLAMLLGFVSGQWLIWSELTTGMHSAWPFDNWLQRNGLVDAGLYVIVVLIGFNRFWARGHYSRRQPFWDEQRQVVEIIFKLALMDFALMMLVRADTSRGAMLLAWGLTLVAIPLARNAARSILRSSGRWVRPTVIIGGGFNALESGAALSAERWMGLEVVAFVLQENEPSNRELVGDLCGHQVQVRFMNDNADSVLADWQQPVIVIALDIGGLNTHTRLIHELQRLTTDLYIIPALRGLPLCGMDIGHFFSHEVLLLHVRNNLGRWGHRLIKRMFDVAVASMLLLVLSPLLGLLAWRVRKDGGPAVFAHERIGRGGGTFRCLKFRTMVPDAQARLQELLDRDPVALSEWERERKLKQDPRITAVGHLLRRTSLDELPQLWNVLKGDMSLVGPRPVIRDELKEYGDQLDYYLEARPGITGLWQISGRSDTTYATRVSLDAWYVRNWSLWYDLVILIRTVKVVLKGEGAY